VHEPRTRAHNFLFFRTESSIGLLDPDLHSLLYSTVVAVGGNARMPGFHQRLESEIRSLAPDTFDVSGTPEQERREGAREGASERKRDSERVRERESASERDVDVMEV